MKRAVVGLVAFSLHQTGRLFARAARVCNHLAAGTLTVEGLRAGIERTWEDFSTSDASVAAGLTRWEEEMIARFLQKDDDVLLVGAGPGRDLIALMAKGYHVTAVEPAQRAVAACRRQLALRGLSADLIEGFFEDISLPRRFDAIIFSGCCYCFIPESRRRIAALRKAAEHLGPRGRILVNYMTEPPGNPVLMRLARWAAAVTCSDWHPEPGDVVLPIDSTRPLFNYEHRFAPGELESEAAAAGLLAVHHCDFPNAPVIVLQPGQTAG
ncbi:MAG: class I SAM-dependent methyltransferase [Vicinamibacterales bacterium]